MKGVQYLIDEEGHKKAVMIDLEEWADIWEDMEDIMYVQAHSGERRLGWDTIGL